MSVAAGSPPMAAAPPPRRRPLRAFSLYLPILIPVLVLSVIPLVQGIWLGFTDYRLGTPARFNFLANYARMLGDRDFWASFRTGFVWTFTVTGGEIVLGMGLALLLNARIPLRGLWRILILIPWAMPPVIKGLIWRFVYHPDAGLLNYALISMGLLRDPINWLSDFAWALQAVVLVGIWTGLPLATVVLLSGLQTIPEELKEAAGLDGASGWRQFRYVTLPLMAPIIVALSSLEFIWNFNSFGLVYVLTEGGPAGLTRLPMLFAYFEGFQYGNLGYAAALGNIMVLIVGGFVLYGVRRQAAASG
ncbi:MAG: carbohydrate ABC transporter permease [bacterium]